MEQDLRNLFRREVLRYPAFSRLRYCEFGGGIFRQHLQFDRFVEHGIEVHADFRQDTLRVFRRHLVEVRLQRKLVQIAEERVSESLQQIVLDEALRLRPGRDFPLLLLLGQEAIFVEPAKRDAHRYRSDFLRLPCDNLTQLGFGLASVHLRFETKTNVAVSPDLGTVGLLLVDVEMAVPFLDVLADQNNPAFLVSVTTLVTLRRQDRFYLGLIQPIHSFSRAPE